MSATTSSHKILDTRAGARVNDAPRASVVVPAYNCAAFIADTLDSILAQTFQDYEIILVNDGSPDTEEFETVLEKYFDRIIYIRQKNGGTAAARNTAIDQARGEFLAFLDGDDLWLPEYLAAQIERLDAADGIDMIYADAELFGNLRTAAKTFMEKSPSAGAVTTESLIDATCNVITSGTIARREKVINVGGFDERLPRIGIEDFDLWFRLAKAGARIFYQRKVLLKYRVSPASLSGGSVARAEREVAALEILREKYDLDAAENAALKKRLGFAAAELCVERGKRNLALENFAAARADFSEANKFHRKFKFRALDLLLGTTPKLARKFFKRARPAEFSFIAGKAEKLKDKR